MLNYFLRNGRIVDEYDLHNAYEIVSGKPYYEDEPGYSKWMYSLLGKSIVSVKKDDELSVEDVLKANSTVKAVRLYRDKNGCTLREAKDAVDQIAAKMREMACLNNKAHI